MTSLRLVSVLAALVAGALLAPPTFAALGGDPLSVQADQRQMNAMLRTTPMVQYQVHEMQVPSGTRVREYVAGGKVFAVAWEGRVVPNLQQLLGDYFVRYTDGAKAQPGSRHRLVIQEPELVMQMSGYLRSFYGRAYIPGSIPQDVPLQEIR